MKDRQVKYGKSYLWDYKHGVAWRAHLENMRIVRELWFNPAEPEANRFLKSSLKNNKKLQGEVKDYIKRKLDAQPSALYRYHLHCNRSVITMSWEVVDIYEYSKQMKADYIKKIQKRGTIVSLEGAEGARTNERHFDNGKNMIAHENENKVYEEENRYSKENDGHGYYITVEGPCHELRGPFLLGREDSEEIQVLQRTEEERCGHEGLHEGLLAIDDYILRGRQCT